MRVNESESPHLILFSPEIAPTVVLDEGYYQKHPDNKRGDTSWYEPFPETATCLILYAEANQVIVEDKAAMHPAELVADAQNGQQKEDGE